RIAMARTRAESRLAARREALRLAGALASDQLQKAESAEARCAEQREVLLTQVEHLRREHGSPMGHGMPTWAYVLSVVALCALELPLLQMAFTTFGLEPIYTLLLSALCAALTGFLGHAAGTLSRSLRVSARPVLWLILLGSVAFVASLAYLRESAMAALSSDTVTLDPVAATWALFAISCATLVAAALLAWHHRVEPLAPELARVTRALNRAHRRTVRARNRLLRISGQELKAAQRLKAIGSLAEHRTHASYLQHRQLVHAYIAANLKARDDNRLPDGLREANLPWNVKE
ncbi:MAG TPA: hypothetical protein VNT75_24950, partial [Symbiobacteriaceae bacterium]|nr:hypothetical protein [Symbiobacteriaceae bacterium]